MSTNGNGNERIRWVIVESRYAALALQPLLDRLTDGTRTIATHGHLFDYQMTGANLSLAPKNPHTVGMISRLNGDDIIIASDSDHQGELIAAHIRALTPDSAHRRCIFNDITEMGVLVSLNNFNNRQYNFDDNAAAKAALLKIANLKLLHSKKSSHKFLTTTSVDIVKHFNEIGRLNQVQTRVFQENGINVECVVPTSFGEAIAMARPAPVVTKDRVIQNALEGGLINCTDRLQDAYINGMLSYTRTDINKLPSFSENTLSDYTLNGALLDIEEYLSDAAGLPHYAIHNLMPPNTPLERRIQLQNRSALSSQYNDSQTITFDNGRQLQASNAYVRRTKGQIAPKNELVAILCCSKDSASSNLEHAAQRYERYFYNGNKLNTGLVDSTMRDAEKHYPQLVEHGVHATIDKALNDITVVEHGRAALQEALKPKKKSQRLDATITDSLTLS